MKLVSWSFISLFFPFLLISSVSAQITIDGSTNTSLTPTDQIIRIDNGLRAGDNLFHSFGEFSVPTGSEAFFNNASDVVNIFSRVTGGNISNIDGSISANGAANLFLINPAGIIFGQGARLDIGGSFYGSTADSVIFPDGVEFATSNPVQPILTINAPIGLRFRDNPGDIVNQSVGSGLIPSGIASRANLALIGGNITLQGGNITANQGRGNIELASVAGNTVVNLEPVNSSFKLGYDEVKNFGNISLTDGSIIFAQSGGDISINARELVIDDRSTVITANFVEGNAGNINLNVSESIKIVGTGLEQFEEVFISTILSQELNIINTLEILQEGTGVFSATLGEGAAGNIAIDTSQLQLIEGGIIGSSTIETGVSGSVIINATDSVKIIGSGIISSPLIGSTGNGNFLEINTVFLNISDGGFISTATFGKGNGNDIFINALEQIDIRTRSSFNPLFPTGIFSSSSIDDGAAGDITINTQRLNLQEGGQIASDSGIAITGGDRNEGGGVSGEITINASESITISGSSSDNIIPSAIATASFTDNDAGEINITTSNLEIRDGGEISISSTGQGDGGTLRISTDSLTLDNGFINADTSFGVGANVDLRINNNLILDNNSQISAVAFNNADGGNINIESGVIVAFPSTTSGDGNDIIANAQLGEGGNILVTADFVLGIEERPATSGNGTNDIDASSQFGSNSIVENIFVETNISEANVLESNQLADKTCRANQTIAGNNNSFTIKGKGGVPSAPNLPLSAELLLVDGEPITRDFSQLNNQQTTQNITSQIQPVKTSQGDIYPARGIIKTEDGRIILTAYPTGNNATRNPSDAASCHQVE